ncbi:hypothetical protein Htur_3473 [Haloterrigena turkmenica DSM 5511]|uniref:Lipoprotein n=1 Tax=Haloterrigena turkmenica (strain ATCC 51198 / DSM 5511 / JCM 9101 / NCIMB 13204 / VKM B-1734 / 4k) TaxID=543526 RepID=D2RQF8_HALTV|nr:hypothetical protein [Haloterrigena turkmenica]ADB62335.1 hypothetical protein Htur_3473 [Haloterrigena turkmenica DSM 5511]
MNRRALLAAVPSIALAGCATRLGIADRVEITRKFVRLHPWDGEEPIDAVVRRYDPDEGVAYDDPHEAIADEIDPDEPLVVPDSMADRLEAEYEIVEYRIRACALDGDDCRETTLVREEFNAVEVGDVVDIVSRSSGAGLVNIHERREERD